MVHWCRYEKNEILGLVCENLVDEVQSYGLVLRQVLTTCNTSVSTILNIYATSTAFTLFGGPEASQQFHRLDIKNEASDLVRFTFLYL